MGSNVKKCVFWAIRGGGGRAWVAQKSHLYQSTYKIWKQSDKDFLSYRENGEVSADAADAADAAA